MSKLLAALVLLVPLAAQGQTLVVISCDVKPAYVQSQRPARTADIRRANLACPRACCEVDGWPRMKSRPTRACERDLAVKRAAVKARGEIPLDGGGIMMSNRMERTFYERDTKVIHPPRTGGAMCYCERRCLLVADLLRDHPERARAVAELAKGAE